MGKKWDFEKHTAGEIDTFQKFQVDVHVERKLALPLETLLLWRDLVVSLDHDTLSKQLLLATTTADFLKSSLSFVDKSGAESTETDLNKSPVEENLAVDIKSADGLL